MKKLFLSFLVSLSLFACKKEPVLTLETSYATLKSMETVLINASGFDNYQFSSEDEYIAAVSDKGVVTALRIGKTKIIVRAEDKVAYFNVDVNPKYNFFSEPLTEWGISRAQLISKLGNPDTSTSDGVGYMSNSTIAPASVYIFDSKGLVASSVLVDSDYSSQLGSFMAERYLLASVNSSEYTIYFINALTMLKASTIVGLKLYNINYWMAGYVRNDSYSKSGIFIENSGLLDKLNKLYSLIEIR
jgi:hypothetical protein